MNTPTSVRVTVVLGSVLMMTACSGSGPRFTARTLQDRLQTQLAPQIASKQVAIQTEPEGARVTLDEAALFSANQANLDPNGGFVIASLAEALLDPRLMQVDVNGAAATPPDLREARANSIRNDIQAYTLGPTLPLPPETTSPGPVSTPPQMLTISIHVHCPPGPQGTTWGYPNRAATCD